MIVCSCNIITQREIADAISMLRTRDPFVVITPGLVFRALGKRPQCGTCLALVTRIFIEEGGDVMDNMGGGPSHPATRG